MNEFEEYELENMPSDEEKKIFIIKDLSGLNWAFRKMAALKKKINEVESLADQEIQRINDWREKELDKYQGNANYFEEKIKNYHESVLAIDDKEKTIKTPYGKIKSVTNKAAPEKVSESELIEYARNNDPELIDLDVKEKLLWSELKKKLKVVEFEGEEMVVDENGMIVPGVIVKPENTTFKVEVDYNE